MSDKAIKTNEFYKTTSAREKGCIARALAKVSHGSNVLVLPGRFIAPELAKLVVQKFSETKFEGGRHLRRLEKISKLEKGGGENTENNL